MRTTLASPCKVNFILNILGKRPDGFHELETVLYPIQAHDLLEFSQAPASSGIKLNCNHPELPTDQGNLVYRAAEKFLLAAKIPDGVQIRLEKKLPLAAGLGGGSANAAITLLGLNELFGNVLSTEALCEIAATLGSDVPFFLQSKPALGVGRGERITPLPEFAALKGHWITLIHPGFGVSTPWAYKNLAFFPDALKGEANRAKRLAETLSTKTLSDAKPDFYNSLEAPVLEKYPILSMFQEFLRETGAEIALMSGSGSSTFAIAANQRAAEMILEKFKGKFGDSCWTAIIPCAES